MIMQNRLTRPERWLSGRKRGFAKSVSGQLDRRFESCPLRLGDWQRDAGHRTESHKPLSAQGLVSFCAGRCERGRAPAACGLCAACAPDCAPLFEALLLQVLFQLLEVVTVTKGARSVSFDAYLFLLLLFPFHLSFFLGAKQGFFLLFPFAFIFTSPVTHICSSLFKKECSSQSQQPGLTSSAHGPFRLCPSLYATRCPSWSSS